jgi:exodeoxyribonuclease VII large subunit
LADEVADLSLATPTMAAVHLGKEWLRAFELMERQRGALSRGYRSLLAAKTQNLRFSGVALERSIESFASRQFERMHALERRLDQRSPAARVVAWQLRLVRAKGALVRSAERLAQTWIRRLERARGLLEGEDPTRPLARGFAIITKDGVAVHNVAVLTAGDRVSARLQRGTFDARVESVHAE